MSCKHTVTQEQVKSGGKVYTVEQHEGQMFRALTEFRYSRLVYRSQHKYKSAVRMDSFQPFYTLLLGVL